MNRGVPFLVLGIGVAVVSTASILIRFAQADGASSVVIAAGRMAIAALAITPFVVSRAGPELLRISKKTFLLCATSGLLLAAHFWSWIVSLAHTSVASSVALVATNPVWVALLSVWLLRETPARAQFAGIALTFAGTVLIFASDNANDGTAATSFLGNSLALLGAMAASGYLLIGRGLRNQLSLSAYVWLTYSFAAIALCVAALAGGETLGGMPATAWLLIAALGLGPQLLGHTAFNWALRKLSVTFVAISILGEPIGSAILAWWLLNERFSTLQLAGFLVLLTGIFVAARAERNRSV